MLRILPYYSAKSTTEFCPSVTLVAIITIMMSRPAILVANKADLVRSRVVSAAEGKQLAERFFLFVITCVIVSVVLIILVKSQVFFDLP